MENLVEIGLWGPTGRKFADAAGLLVIVCIDCIHCVIHYCLLFPVKNSRTIRGLSLWAQVFSDDLNPRDITPRWVW